ncbi:C-C motif chemokine 3-like isoform X2 [Haplochromis burtoni]|uniref:C-C motif chemokine 3-like isoform X1 n=1 Tax=Haplochromis burtoni TaxID=8153 RepID=UPI001C2DB7FC|nr:C-C motif chemokine 3-like isoform X1 [Haplochromis burtoni]XP_042073328.1 C-C motif chemokine 3-like isoform X2 [Haplochromis burtoni]
MKTTHILLLCILGAALLTAVNCTNANGPDNCCFKFYPRRIKPMLYYMTDHRCPKPAAIFVTKKARSVCMDPSLSWVDSIMKALDESTF